MLGFKERSLVMGMEVILATTGSEACVFKWKNAQGVLHKTSTGGKPDYLNLSWSELAQRRLEGEVKLPVDVGPHQVLGDGGWVEKLDLSRHKRWRGASGPFCGPSTWLTIFRYRSPSSSQDTGWRRIKGHLRRHGDLHNRG